MTWFSRLYRAWINRPDPAARVTGLKFTTGRDYDQVKARAGYQKAQRHTATGRKLPTPRTQKLQAQPRARVLALPRQDRA